MVEVCAPCIHSCRKTPLLRPSSLPRLSLHGVSCQVGYGVGIQQQEMRVFLNDDHIYRTYIYLALTGTVPSCPLQATGPAHTLTYTCQKCSNTKPSFLSSRDSCYLRHSRIVTQARPSTSDVSVTPKEAAIDGLWSDKSKDGDVDWARASQSTVTSSQDESIATEQPIQATDAAAKTAVKVGPEVEAGLGWRKRWTMVVLCFTAFMLW